jgi:WD40 repeat protein
MRFLTHSSGFRSVAYTSGGALYATSVDGRVWTWDESAGRLRCVFAPGRPIKPAWGAVPSPDGRWLVVRGNHNDVLLRAGPPELIAEVNGAGDRFPPGWEARTLLSSFHGPPQFTADSGVLIADPSSSEFDYCPLFWNLETFARAVLPIPGNWRLDQKAWGSGRALISVLCGAAPFFDVVSLDLAGPHELTHHGSFLDFTNAFRVCRTDWLVVPGSGGNVRLLRPLAASFEVASEFSVTSTLYDIDRWTVSADGRRLLTAFGSEVALWDTESGREIASWDWRIGTINSVAFAPDGLTAAAAGSNKKLVVWDLED